DEIKDVLGEVVADKPDLLVIRLAKDPEELPRDRRIYPGANVVLAWMSACNLVAASPRSVFLACADLHSDTLVQCVPDLKPGEVCLGPVFFGFRFKEPDVGH